MNVDGGLGREAEERAVPRSEREADEREAEERLAEERGAEERGTWCRGAWCHGARCHGARCRGARGVGKRDRGGARDVAEEAGPLRRPAKAVMREGELHP